jgi:hemerythrin
MKNIHVIPTDKPSRLLKGTFGLQLLPTPSNGWKKPNQNIYITSDEEIKEGDWFLNENNKLEKAIPFYNYKSLSPDCKKIILTTDQDLIKDGVQAIPGEFLEWFVNNTSCESVEVKKENQFFRSGPLDLLGYSVVSYKIIIPEKITRCCGRCNGIDDLCYTDMTCDNHNERGCETCYGKRVEYKIAIPKEEPKQDRTCTNSCSVVCGECQILEPKQEKCTCEVGHPYNNLCCKVHGSISQEEPKQHVDFINQNIEEFNENLENFKKLVSDETSPALKDFAKMFKNHCLECNKNLEECSCKEGYKESIKDIIISQVSEETKQKAREYGDALASKDLNVIKDWLEKHGDPEIAKQVEKEAKELHEKETLEEAAKRVQENFKTSEEKPYELIFTLGAKWQAERMYSEEELRESFTNGFYTAYGCKPEWLEKSPDFFNIWFKQFKNKKL